MIVRFTVAEFRFYASTCDFLDLITDFETSSERASDAKKCVFFKFFEFQNALQSVLLVQSTSCGYQYDRKLIHLSADKRIMIIRCVPQKIETIF